MKIITLCADDFGQNESISQGILNLIAKKRLSATSCMVNMTNWQHSAPALRHHHGQIDIGLHFNLTEGRPLSSMIELAPGGEFPPLSHVLRQAHFRRLSIQEIRAELICQLEAFETTLGYLPDFIDGHQHIHHLPIVRQALVDNYKQRHYRGYIRITHPQFSNAFQAPLFKNIAIARSGATTLKRQLRQYSIPFNHSFSGIYNFTQSAHYDKLFPKFLQQVNAQGLIMCHPGLQSTDYHDAIAKSRYDEYRYFNSDKFIDACEHADISLSRFVI